MENEIERKKIEEEVVGETQTPEINNSTKEEVVDGCDNCGCEDVEIRDEMNVGKPIEVMQPSADMTDEQKAVEKMLSQSQVNEIVGRTRTETRDGTLKSVWERYGVDNEEGLDEIVGNGQRFPALKEEMDNEKKSAEQRIAELEGKLGDITTELALYKSDTNPDRYEDIKLILKGKGLDITAENIANEMSTHPEWKKVAKSVEEEKPQIAAHFKKEEAVPSSVLERLGNEKSVEKPVENEYDAAMELFDIGKK